MTLALHARGVFTWPEWAATLADAIRDAQAQGDPDHGDTYYTHWLTALERIATAKGCVTRDRSGFAHVFRPVVERTALIDRGLQEVADKLCGGSLTPLITHLTGIKKLSAKDRQALRKWIEDQT